MGCGKDFADGEKLLVIEEISNVKTNRSIAERIHRFRKINIKAQHSAFSKAIATKV